MNRFVRDVWQKALIFTNADNFIVIEFANKRDYWKYNIQEKELKFVYPRAERGDAHGQYDLAQMYLKGQGVLKNEEQGLFWLRKSAEQNFKRAKNQLKKIGGNASNGLI